jgi:hypothetical protein
MMPRRFAPQPGSHESKHHDRYRQAGVPVTGTFRSLNNFNYRLWAGGALISNVGTWMQALRRAGWC